MLQPGEVVLRHMIMCYFMSATVQCTTGLGSLDQDEGSHSMAAIENTKLFGFG